MPPRPVKNVGKKDQTATKTMEGRPSQQKQPKASGGGADRVGTGGYDRVHPGEDAMRRLGGGGGYSTAQPSSGGTKTGRQPVPKSGGAAIITPAAGPAQIQQRPVKPLGKSDNTFDYGGGRHTPKPLYVR